MKKKEELVKLESSLLEHKKRFTSFLKHTYNELTQEQRDKICGLLEEAKGGQAKLARQSSKGGENIEKSKFKFEVNKFMGFA